MYKSSGEKGITLLEVLISMTLFVCIVATLMPVIVNLKKHEILWREKMKIQQEAIRFFTYLENRNSCYDRADIQNQKLILYICRNESNSPKVRTLYFHEDKIYEQQNGEGYIELAQHVQAIQYTIIDNGIEIQLTLSYGRTTETFTWTLRRHIEK